MSLKKEWRKNDKEKYKVAMVFIPSLLQFWAGQDELKERMKKKW